MVSSFGYTILGACSASITLFNNSIDEGNDQNSHWDGDVHLVASET